MKTWRGNEKTDDKIIGFGNSIICKGNPGNDEIEQCLNDLKNNIIPTKNFITIPLSYIKEIRLQEKKNDIEILFGNDSEENLRINDPIARSEIFNHLRLNLPGTEFLVEKYSKFKAGKKPLIAMVVVLVLFLWSLHYAVGYDNGYEYEIKNGHYGSLTGVVLAIASYGVKKVILVFGTFLAIAIWAFIRKIKNPPTFSRIKFKR